ncbi:MAG: hypothetical protein AAB288_13395, partial [Acidobacteriota bacterium]
EGKVTVINPRGSAGYQLATYTYTTGGPFSGEEPSFSDLSGQRVVQVDFGLLQPLPDAIEIKASPSILPTLYQVKTETKTKLRKRTPEKNFSIDKAIAMATGNAHAYFSDDMERAIKSLGDQPPHSDIQEALFKCIESKKESSVAAAFGAIGNYEKEIPDDRLMAWLNSNIVKDKAKPADGDNVNDAARERVERSAGILARRNDGALLKTHFSKLPQASQKAILDGMDEGFSSKERPSSDLRKFLISSAMKNWPQGSSVPLHHKIQDDRLELDDGFVEQVDTYIAGLKEENDKRLWNGVWWRKLCRASPKMQNSWITPRLVGMIQEKKPLLQYDIKGEAVNALIQRDESAQLIPLFSNLDTPNRQIAVRNLSSKCHQDKAASDGSLAFAKEALKDEDNLVREMAFSLLCDFGIDRPGIQENLQAALSSEADSRIKSEMDQKLSRMVTSQLDGATTEDFFALATSGPTQTVVGKALDKLLFNPERAANLSTLAQSFSQTQSAQHRAWFLLELGRFERFRSDENYKAQFDSVVEMGLADSDNSVRATAVHAMVSCLPSPLGLEADQLLATLTANKDAARRQEMLNAYHGALAKRLGHLLKSDSLPSGTRPQANQKLLEIAGSPDEQAALAALDGLEMLYDVNLVPTITVLLKSAPSEDRKIKILSKTGVNNDEALPLVLPVFEAGLADPSAKVREHAFETLKKWSGSRDRKKVILPQIKTVAEKETDPETKKKMDEWLKSAER